jgi:type VI secretion system protein ImpF
MARLKTDQPVLPSLLDRLIDDDPDRMLTISKTYGAILSDIKSSIRRDLESLLNTRLYRPKLPEKFGELDVSIVNYGLPDFSVIQLGTHEGKEEFRIRVQTIIENFEPRFSRVVVELDQIGEDYERTLYLKISAVLMVDPDPIPLLFDSRVKTMDKSVRLRELKNG